MAPTKKVKKGKKKWFNILASKEFNEQRIGETVSYDADSLVGRKLTVNLSVLTNDFRRQSKSLTFKIREVNGPNAFTELIQFQLSPMNIKRFVRKEKDRVDDTFDVETKDGVKAIIKPLMVTRAHTQRFVHMSLRLALREFLRKEAKENSFSDLVMGLVTGNIQKMIKSQLKKVYPLSVAEIRMMRKL